MYVFGSLLLFVMLLLMVLFDVAVYVVCWSLVRCCVFELVIWRLVQIAGGLSLLYWMGLWFSDFVFF